MTEAQLREIEERAGAWLCSDGYGDAAAGKMARTDIPALVAEVRRLQLLLDEDEGPDHPIW